jgi:serine/threonine-protein kinase
MTIDTGTRLGPYEIIAPLGAGGMGEVYLAEDIRLKRKVAVKLLPAELTANRDRLRRFEQEAQAASALNHPNIITIHEIGQVDGLNFIVTEFIAGETLRRRMATERMNRPVVLDVATQVAGALAAAHAAGIVHRDLKPENIMVRPDGLIKVLDFGLAKLTEPPTANVDTEAPTVARVDTMMGTVMGTAQYMSPEQARGLKVDARTDIFSLGVVLYEMLAGRAPFLGATTADIISVLLQKEPQPLSTLAPDVPAELQHIVSKAMRKDRDERYQTVKSLLIDLTTLKQELEFAAKLERSAAPERQGAPAQNRAQTSTANGAIEIAETQAATPRPTSSAEYIVSHIGQHPGLVASVTVLLLAALAFGYWFYEIRASSLAQIESIAVLPFVNASGNAEVEYLSDGMTDMLITSLSQLPKLSVKARSSVFRYKGKDASPQQVGKELNVQAILTGRLVQHGNDLTLHIELVDPKTETALWSGDYNRSITNLVSLQGEIARDVSEKLRLRLTSTEQQRLAKRGTENAEAYQAYLKGRYYWNKGPAQGYAKSREYFQQAIDLDSNYALAYCGLADYYGFASAVGLLSPNENWPKAEAAVNKSLALDDTRAETYNPLAAVKVYYYRDWPAAERDFRRGIELNPNYAEIHLHYAMCLVRLGRGEEALAEIQRAVELEPLSLGPNLSWAKILFYMRQHDRAIDQLGKTLELETNFAAAHDLLGDAYEQKGMHREAITEWGKALTLRGAGEQASSLEQTYAASGFEAAVRALAQRRLEIMNEKVKHGEYVPAIEYATAYIRLGDKEQAFAWLDKAVQERNSFALEFKVNPIYDKLRDDMRFQDLIRRVGLPL